MRFENRVTPPHPAFKRPLPSQPFRRSSDCTDLRAERLFDKFTYGVVGFVIGAVLCLVIGALV